MALLADGAIALFLSFAHVVVGAGWAVSLLEGALHAKLAYLAFLAVS